MRLKSCTIILKKENLKEAPEALNIRKLIYYTTYKDITAVASNHTLHLAARAIEYTLAYHLNGGSGASVRAYTIESPAVTLPLPEKDGFTFAGWYDNAEFSGSSVAVIPTGSVGNREFWAKWEAPHVAPPFIIAHPESQTVGVGVSVVFSVGATGESLVCSL